MKLFCWILGHKWVFLFGSTDKHFNLCHLNPMAGEDHICVRCGDLWEDAYPEHRRMFYAGRLPERGVYR